MKRIYVILAGIVIFVGVLVVLSTGMPERTPGTVTPPPDAAAPDNAPEEVARERYVSETYNFLFEYPLGVSVTEGPDSVYTVGEFFGEDGNVVVTAALADDAYQGTNYHRGFAGIAVSDTQSEAECQMFRREGEQLASQLPIPIEINGVRFYRGQTAGAAAGTIAQNRIYHGFYGGRCYEISLNVFYSNIGNYEPGTVVEFDKEDVWSRLESIALSFEFTN